MPSKKYPAPEPGVVDIYPKAEKKKSIPVAEGFTLKTLPRWDGFFGKDGKLRVNESPREAREAKVLKLEEHIVHLKAENKRLRDVISFLSAPLEFGSSGGFHIDR